MARSRREEDWGSMPDFDSSPDVFIWMKIRNGSLLESDDVSSASARPLFRRLAFLMLSTLSTAQRFGTSLANSLHLLLWSPPMKCHRIVLGRSLDFSTSSCT